MNLQIAATLSGRIAAIGPIPVHGARHDARAFAASGLKHLLVGIPRRYRAPISKYGEMLAAITRLFFSLTTTTPY
jgi:hypothetical protein